MKNIVALGLLCLLLSLGIPSHAMTPDEQTPALEDVCDGQVGAAYGLCTAYCEAMDCDSDEPKASEDACASVEAKYEEETEELPPCIDPCAGCPCNYFDVQMVPDCWVINSFPFWFEQLQSRPCQLSQGSATLPSLTMRADSFSMQCEITGFDNISCGNVPRVIETGLTEDQIIACQCLLEQYANELATVQGIQITGEGPPFSCMAPMP